jgi:hypothetical protein
MTSKGLKCTCTFLARWAILAKLEDVCGKSNDCKKLRDAKFINENGVWKPRN